MKAVLLLSVLGLAAATASESSNPTADALLAEVGPSGFVYQPSAANNSQTQTSLGAATQRRTAEEWPALTGAGISQNSFVLAACALRTPHVHPNAVGLLYAVQAENLQVGFTTTSGAPVVNNISTGGSAVFPIGLVHYQLNLGCSDAVYTISYSSDMPQTQQTVPSLYALPDEALATALGISTAQVNSIKSGVPTGNFITRNQACMQACGAKTNGTLGTPDLKLATAASG